MVISRASFGCLAPWIREGIRAEFEAGILIITLPKRER